MNIFSILQHFSSWNYFKDLMDMADRNNYNI